VWVAGGAGPCLLLLGSSAVAHGLQQDVELQRLRHVLSPLLELVAHGEQLLRLEVELHAPHAGECALRCAVGGVRVRGAGARLPSWCDPPARVSTRRGSC